MIEFKFTNVRDSSARTLVFQGDDWKQDGGIIAVMKHGKSIALVSLNNYYLVIKR